VKNKEFTGMWISKEILSMKDIKHVEKLVLSMAHNLPDGIRMADSTIAGQIGVSERSVSGILASLVSKGYLLKTGTHSSRLFVPTTQDNVVRTTQGDVVQQADYAVQRNQLRKAAKSTTQGCDHKEHKHKESKENSNPEDSTASLLTFEEAQANRKKMAQFVTPMTFE
jgi:hypothetical protein